MLTPTTHERISILFPDRQDQIHVARLLETECGNNLPFAEPDTSEQLERIRYAALKYSGGDMIRLREAIELAKIDWRDLLVAAGFARHVDAHLDWRPQRDG